MEKTKNFFKNELESLQSEVVYLRNVIETLPGSIYWKDKKGVYLGHNTFASERMRFYNLDPAMTGKTDYDLFPKEVADKYRTHDLQVIETGEGLLAEEALVLPDGKKVIQLSTKKPLRNNKGEVIGVIGNTVDITHLKEIEEGLRLAKEKAEASDKAKTEFLDNMRHDLRTPVSGIVGFSQIIKQEAKEPNVREYAENLLASGNALLDFLDEILEAVSVSTGDVPVMKKKFELKEKVLEIIQLNQPKAKEKKLDLSLSYDDRIPKYFVGDSKRIQRILLELIANALNFTHQGHVKAIISLAKSNGREKVIRLEVEDTGIGIPENQQEEIFLRFKRLTPAYQGIYKGAGLGLSIVKQFIDDLHGEIKVKSTKEGSTFICLIPLDEPLLAENEEQTPHQGTAIPRISMSKKKQVQKYIVKETGTASAKNKILVVEDNEIAADIATLLLASLNCDVDVAKNGEEALKLFQANPYDLIFMDIGLPDIDGYQVTQRIRALEWKSDYHIPIVALSAHTTIEHKQTCIEKGMTAVLVKPLVLEKAADILNAFIPSRVKKETTTTPDSQPQEAGQNELLIVSGSVIDSEHAANMGFTQKVLEERLFPLVLKTIPIDLAQLQEAYKKGDWKSVQDLAHKLKGGAAYCGALRMKEACSRLEAYLMEGKTALRSKLYELVLTEIDAATKNIEQILAKKKNGRGKKAA